MNDTTKLNEIITSIINLIIIPLLPVVSAYLIAFIKAKTSELQSKISSKELSKYMDIAENAVITAVTAVNQTFTDDLKKKNGKLSADEQKTAFDMAKNKVIEILGDQALKVLNEAYNDLDIWIDNRIEYYVNQAKVKPEILEKKVSNDAAPI